MQAIARYIKEGDPLAKVVFVGPCIAKKGEMARGKDFSYVDCAITFEELQALFDAKGIDLSSLAPTPLDNASYFGRIFARSGGVADAMKEGLKERGSDFPVQVQASSGLDQCKSALNSLKSGTASFNFLEGMACPGGCIGGPCCLTHEVRDAASVDKYGHESKETTIKGSLSGVMAIEKND